MSIIEKAQEMKITIPTPPKPVGAYVPCVKSGIHIITSGQIPVVDGQLLYKGKLGKDFSVEEGYQAARICILNCLGVVQEALGSLDKVKRIVKVTGFVHSDSEFYDQPKVINGASELLVALFGEVGRHARSAIGVNALPLGAAVEIEMMVEIDS